jgi:hypothetical protein
MFCTYSGTGIVLFAVGLMVVLVRAPRAIRPSMVAIGAVGIAALLLSPYAEPLLDRTDEASDSSSSLSLRFVAPYQQVASGLEQEPWRYLIGSGPGASERVLESARDGSGLAVVYTIIPKVIFEYGFLAGSLFLTFLAVALFRRPPAPIVPLALAVMLALLSGSLLQPHTILLAWLLSAVWARGDLVPAGLQPESGRRARVRRRALGAVDRASRVSVARRARKPCPFHAPGRSRPKRSFDQRPPLAWNDPIRHAGRRLRS